MFGQIEFNEEEKIKLRKKLPIIGGLVVFAILISLYANTFKKDALQTIKETKNRNLIYTVKERTVDGKKSEVPIINIEGENIDKLNKDIENFVNKYYSNPTSIISYSYEKGTRKLPTYMELRSSPLQELH